MNINPVQNNNSQSFGMAFKLKGDGAKRLATLLEETNPATNKHIMDDLIAPINSLKTEVVYDGENVIVGALKVSDTSPVGMPGTYKHDLQYPIDNGKHVYHVWYKEPKKRLIDVYEAHPLMQKLFNAREIAKDMDAKAAQKAYNVQMAAEKQARIDEEAKKLQDMFG